MVYDINRSSTLIATLGTEPQVVTATIDLLRAQGENLSAVAIVHTVSRANPAIHNALTVLQQTTQEPGYAGIGFSFPSHLRPKRATV